MQYSDLYDAYGKRLSVSPGGDPYCFGAQAGHYTNSEMGLCLLTHRYYDPQSGRFLTRDPTGYDGRINLYSYTQNNSTSHTLELRQKVEVQCSELCRISKGAC